MGVDVRADGPAHPLVGRLRGLRRIAAGEASNHLAGGVQYLEPHFPGLAGKPIDVFNYGNHRRDFTYIDDIVEGVVRVIDNVAAPNPDWSGDTPDSASSKGPYRLYNIGNNQPVELMHYIEVLEDCLGKKAEKNMLPLQPGDVPATYADVSDLVNDVGYKPDMSVEQGVANFVEWYRDFYRI